MAHASDLIATDITAYLSRHEHKELLRFITCGSVDDGKSTLIGRLLYDSKMLYEDHLSALKSASLKHGTTGNDFDPALITDGLRAEREQGITIDVAYRYFSTERRKFIIADTPGHEQYTRNMATGASTADLAVILIDARYGVLTQTRRHSFIASLLGIRHLVVAVNKMDLVGWAEARFHEIVQSYHAFSKSLALPEPVFIPMAALSGDNVVTRSKSTPWYAGPPLMEVLETVPLVRAEDYARLRLPIQRVSRPDQDFRGFQGTLAAGVLRPGDTVRVLPSGRESRIERIVGFKGDLELAYAPEAVTITLTDEVDVSRGDVLVSPAAPAEVSHSVVAHVVWMAEQPLVPGRSYFLRQASLKTPVVVSAVEHRIDVNTLERSPADALELNAIGVCRLTTTRPLVFDAYAQNRTMGAFILVDRLSNNTVGAGMIIGAAAGSARDALNAALEQEARLATVPDDLVSSDERRARLGSAGGTLCVRGPGREAVVRALVRRLFDLGVSPIVWDGAAEALVQQGFLVLVPTPGQGPTLDVPPEALLGLVVEDGLRLLREARLIV